jgi:outer membrane protein insertion porin family
VVSSFHLFNQGDAMSRNLFFRSVVLLGALVVCVWASAASAQGVLRGVTVKGNERIETETILSYMDVRPGDAMGPDALDRIIKSLFRTGLFADVSARQTGDGMEVTVVENPVINEIAFEGNSKIKDEDLLSEVQLRSRHVFTKTKVQSDVARLYDLYRRSARFSASIEPKIIKLEQNRVNLVFEINEGAVTKVDSIRFVGNRRFGDDQLRGEISTKESHWYSFLSADDRYDQDRLAYDQELLRKFYLSQGYADFRVVSAVAELSQSRDAFFITFTVEEGKRYKVGKVDIRSSLRGLDPALLKPDVSFRSGDWYDAGEVQKTVDDMTKTLGDLQYAFAVVRPGVEPDPSQEALNIVFEVAESPKVYVERIDIHGNTRTLDKVIRREIALDEGDPFSRTKLAKSEQNIRDLDYFETVAVKPQPGSTPDKTVLDVGVAEKSTGELSVGAGFSTSDGPLADLKIRERNFLGRGQMVDFSTTVSGERTEFDTSFTEPYFLDRDLSAGVDAFHVTRDLQSESSYDQRRTGGGLRLGYPLSEKWRQSLRYQIESNDIRNVSDNASRYIREQEGSRVTSAVSQRLTYDNRDSTLFPTDGLLSWLDMEVAGLGGDARYVSGKLGSSWYHPVFETWVFNLLGEVGGVTGYSDEDVAINERFFIGGNSLRGFKKSGIGPRDLVTDDALGGNLYYRGSAELTFPLSEELGLKGHTFSDFGSLWSVDNVSGPDVVDENALRAAAGLGLSWRSPMGPIRIDLAQPFLKEDYDQKESFRFSFGTRF